MARVLRQRDEMVAGVRRLMISRTAGASSTQLHFTKSPVAQALLSVRGTRLWPLIRATCLSILHAKEVVSR